ncbi:hypothetical protein ILUMI_06225 [Ignelater luminosus]|uniref:Mitochondrial potassium channel ATP-binding subunit n=1 Tax=Ignelater luminosus TaxID=2038154 RepID=A0A8K0DB39_IGNLU|nr:hypothetical protein ILUMI_06225 [Ignelater luminosus]
MWKIFQCSSSIQNTIKRSLLFTQNSILKSYSPQVIRYHSTKQLSNKPVSKCTYTFSTLTKIGFTFTCGTLLKVTLSNNKTVLCKPATTRLEGYRTLDDRNLKFDWKKLWKYIEPHIWYLVAAILGALAVAILNIQIPQIMGGVVNVVARFSDSHDSEHFLKEMKKPALKLVSMYIAQSAFTFFYINMLSHLGERVAYNMKTDLFASILKQDIAFFDQQRTGEIVNRLTSDIQDFKSSFKQVVSGGLRASTQIIGCSISLIVISPQMTFITLLCVPAVIVLGSAVGSVLRQTSRRAQAQVEKSTAVADEAISNIRTVRAFAMEDQELELFKKEAKLAMVLNEELGFGIGLFQAGTNMFLNSIVLATLYMGGYLLSTNQLSAGQLMAYLMATQTIQRSLAQISLLFGTVVRGVAAGARVFQYLDMQPTMNLKGGQIIPSFYLKGNIEFRNVTFAYPARPQHTVLKNFNLKVEAGKTVAIVGASGNGKSTVVALLERFYDTNDGQIILDGKNIAVLDPSWLRQRVFGYISQEPILFATTVMENIRYGQPDATDEEVKKAAELANAHDFITNFPNGYNTLVGERGTTLSGGQKQRIAIARALLKNPIVLILDEATSALDTESEKVVQAALEKAGAGRTVLVIAHRLSTIENADLIVVLDKGNIVEMGTHEELKEKKGLYWSLNYQQQPETPPIPAG